MKQHPLPDRKAVAGAAFNEKKRLALLLLATIGVGIAFVSLLTKAREVPQDEQLLPFEEEPEETIALPEIPAARIDALVEDAQPADRVVLESEGLDVALGTARLLTPRHFAALGGPELDRAGVERLLADPSAHRGQPFLARGWLESLRQRRRGPESAVEHLGKLQLEDGTPVYFVALELPDESIEGDYVRLDGLFLKVFSEESAEERGRWIEGPLLVGPRLVRSYPDIGTVTEIDPKLYETVLDDYLMSQDGEPPRWEGLPFEATWHLMAYARDLPAGAVDWEAAPELDRDLLLAVARDGTPHRFRPFRIPISRLQGARVRKAPENPARIREYTEGWIGNTTWRNVLQFQAPAAWRELELADYVYGHGFFLKNFAYESVDGVRIAPAFVLVSLERHEPTTPSLLRTFALVMAVMMVLLTLTFVVLLRRDKRSAAKLEQDLIRRRRARAERAQRAADAPSP